MNEARILGAVNVLLHSLPLGARQIVKAAGGESSTWEQVYSTVVWAVRWQGQSTFFTNTGDKSW